MKEQKKRIYSKWNYEKSCEMLIYSDGMISYPMLDAIFSNETNKYL